MKCRYALALLFTATASSAAAAAEPAADGAIVVPLKKIWALEMPGTRKLSSALKDGQYVIEGGSFVREIRRALGRINRTEDGPGESFVVAGDGLSTLEMVRDILTGKNERQSQFGSGEPLTLVFFSASSGSYVHLVEVVRRKSDFEIRYRFHPHLSREVTTHFALIPLGRLTPGQYSVAITQVEMKRTIPNQSGPAINDEWARNTISRPTKFLVK